MNLQQRPQKKKGWCSLWRIHLAMPDTTKPYTPHSFSHAFIPHYLALPFTIIITLLLYSNLQFSLNYKLFFIPNLKLTSTKYYIKSIFIFKYLTSSYIFTTWIKFLVKLKQSYSSSFIRRLCSACIILSCSNNIILLYRKYILKFRKKLKKKKKHVLVFVIWPIKVM